VILVDSDVLIEHTRGTPAATTWLDAARRETGRMATSVASVVEVVGGMRSDERRRVRTLLSSLRVFSATERVAWKAAEFMRTYRRSHSGIDVADYLIAATVEIEGLELATLNVRDFPMFPGLTPPFEVN
jgi:predicted nucleic acid-binding protein